MAAVGNGEMLDQAMREAAGLQFSVLDKPIVVRVAGADTTISLQGLPTRPCTGIRTIYHMFDIQEDVDMGVDIDKVCADFCVRGTPSLPDHIRPTTPLPPGAKLQLVFQPCGEASSTY